jgi:hypothetical protein
MTTTPPPKKIRSLAEHTRITCDPLSWCVGRVYDRASQSPLWQARELMPCHYRAMNAYADDMRRRFYRMFGA